MTDNVEVGLAVWAFGVLNCWALGLKQARAMALTLHVCKIGQISSWLVPHIIIFKVKKKNHGKNVSQNTLTFMCRFNAIESTHKSTIYNLSCNYKNKDLLLELLHLNWCAVARVIILQSLLFPCIVIKHSGFLMNQLLSFSVKSLQWLHCSEKEVWPGEPEHTEVYVWVG